MRTGSVGFQLKALADLLQKIYASVDLSQIAGTVSNFVRDAIPPHNRAPSTLRGIERRMTVALEDLYFSGLHPDLSGADPETSLAERISTAESHYHDTIEDAARTIERAVPDSDAGHILRAAAPVIAEAAGDIAERRRNDFALDIARDAEGLGAAPSLLFGIDGRIVWTNHALTEMCEQRQVEKTGLIQSASRFAAPLCAALRRREKPGSRKDKRKRLPELGVHLVAEIKRQRGSPGEALLLVQVSEAKRVTDLSPREQEVACLVARHGSYRKAAELAGVSLDSVRTYVRRIYRKFGVSNRVQLKARLIREGLYEDE